MENILFGRVDEASARRTKIDLRDKKILSMLSIDGRMPLSAIARKIRCSRDTVDYRIRRLVKNGIILGFVPIINFSFFGFSTFHVFMVIHTLSDDRKMELIRTLSGHPNTRSVMEYHDAWDIEWVLIARSLKDFDSIIIDVTSRFSDIIVRKDKLILVRGMKSIQLPGTLYRENTPVLKRKRERKEARVVDDGDLAILGMLSRNSRMSTYDISGEVGLSPDTVGKRIKRLVDSGIIHGFTIITNLNRLDYHLYTLCIDVRNFDLKNDMKFREFISSNPFVMRAVKVIGDWDLLIYVASDSPENFHLTFKQIQFNLGEVISDYETWMAYREYVFKVFPECLAARENFL
ncbi:AsnC family transcriptional regulator [Candidatus Woesearchaeota archaeon]|nr:AsnC family transcriptional regulator [Candidatus Woesearchaeota archaeon]